MVAAAAVKGSASAMPDVCAGRGKERVGMFDPLRGIDDGFRLGIVMLGQSLDLLDVENAIGFHERDGAFFLGTVCALFGLGYGVGINNGIAALTLSDMRAKPREADNRVTVLARVLSWAATDGELEKNVLENFDRAYTADRSDKIWLPEHVDAFMDAAEPEMRLAMVLALHTGQRQADIRKLAWSQYDGTTITLRQGKTGAHVRVPCTAALKATLDGLPKRGALILLTKTNKAFQKRYFAERWDIAKTEAAKTQPDISDLHFHDIRGTTVTMLFEAGCTVAEVASITGHSLRRAQEILDKYLSRTSTMATNAIAKFENILPTESAKRLQNGN